MTGKQSKVVKATLAQIHRDQERAWFAYLDDLDARSDGLALTRMIHDSLSDAIRRWYCLPENAPYTQQMEALGQQC